MRSSCCVVSVVLIAGACLGADNVPIVKPRPFKTFAGHEAGVTCIAFSQNCKYIAATAQDGLLIAWDFASGKELFRRKIGERAYGVAFTSADGRTLAAVGTNPFVYSFSISGEAKGKRKAHDGPIACIAISPDWNLIATGGYDRIVRLLDQRTGKERELGTHEGRVTSVSFSPDGKLLAAGATGTARLSVANLLVAESAPVRVWRLDNGRPIYLGVRGDYVDFSGDGRTLLVAAASCVDVRPSAAPDGQPGTGISGYTQIQLVDTAIWQAFYSRDNRGSRIIHVPGRQWFITAAGSNLHGEGNVFGGGAGRDDCDGRLTIWDALANREIVRLEEVWPANAASARDGRFLTWPDSLGRIIVVGMKDCLQVGPETGQLAPAALGEQNELWRQLGGSTPAAVRATTGFRRSPAIAVTWLERKLQASEKKNALVIDGLIERLDSSSFKERQVPVNELYKLGPLNSEPSLRSAYEKSPSVQRRQQLENILKSARTDPDERSLRNLRAVQLLADIAAEIRTANASDAQKTAETARNARLVLERLAAGAEGFLLTREAKSALNHLELVDKCARER